MQTISLSEAAIALLRHILDTKDARVTLKDLESFRELARAEVMYPVSGFVSGPEANFRFTDEGWAWVNGPASPLSLPAKSASPHR
jgi:hypothetical protein